MNSSQTLARVKNALSLLLALGLTLIMQGCGGGDVSTHDPTPTTITTYTIGGNVTGLTGTLVLQNNGVGTVNVTTNGTYQFDVALAEGHTYNATILTQPDNGTCAISNGNGTVTNQAVTTIAISCAPNTYTVGGNVSGLGASSLMVQNNGTGAITVAANGNFQFDTALPENATYNITLLNQPANYNCTVSNGGGMVEKQNITTVAINCTLVPTYTVGGTITGLTGTLVVQNNGRDNLTISAGATNFTFGTVLTSGAPYAVVAITHSSAQTCTVSSGSGTIAATNVSNVAINCRPKAWGSSTLIETSDVVHAYAPQIFVDASGNALAAWIEYNSLSYAIQTRRYTVGSGWGRYAQLGFHSSTDAEAPQIAFDASGNALAVWTHYGGTNSIHASRYSADRDWWAPYAPINVYNAGNADDPHIAFDASGNALAVWKQYDGTRFNLWANRYSAGSGWGNAAMIETDNAGSAWAPQIAIDASGNALAVWAQSDGAHFNIWANRFSVGTGWGNAVLVETNNTRNAYSPKIAVDASGNALAVWEQSDGTRYNIRASRYTVGSGWGNAAMIETDNAGDAVEPQIAIDISGNALAVWSQIDGTGYRNIYANRYTIGSGWGSAVLIETDNKGYDSAPQIAFDTSGNALAVWSQHGNRRGKIYVNLYTVSSGWGIATSIETDNEGAGAPHVAFDASGNALAVWAQHDGKRYNIWANRYQ